MNRFHPSQTSKQQAQASLRYAQKVIRSLSRYLEEVGEDDVPSWVLDRITQSARLLGQALSFVRFKKK